MKSSGSYQQGEAKVNDPDEQPWDSIMEQVRHFRAMSAEEKDKFVTKLPPFAAPLLKAAEDMSDRDLGNVIKGAEGMSAGNLDSDAIGVMHRAYLKIPLETRREVASGLPPHVQAFIPAVESMPTQTVVELAEGVLELKENPTTADPETIGKAICHLKELPKETKSALKQELVDMKAVEETQIDLLEEVLEGMTGEEAVECIKMISDESKKAQSSTPQQDRDLEDEGGMISEETKNQLTMMAQMAKMLVKIEVRRLTAWVKESPTSVRVLNFLGGLAIFALLLLWCIWLSLFQGHFFQFVLQLWLLLFSLVIMALNAHVRPAQRYVVPVIEFWCPMLATTYGRGWFLVLTGLLGVSSCNGDTLTLYPMIAVALGAVVTGGRADKLTEKQ